MYLRLIWFDHINISGYIYSESYYPVVKYGSHHTQNSKKKILFEKRSHRGTVILIRQTQLRLQDMNEFTNSKR